MQRVSWMLMAILALMIGACRHETDQTSTTSAQVTDTGSDTAATGSLGTSPTTAIANVPDADKSFANDAAQAGMAEVNAGNMGLQKTSNADVKAFAQRMVTDHTKANDELKQLATTKGLTLPADVNDEQKAAAAHLSGLSGAEFDKAYMDHMVADHEKAVSLFQNESTSGGDADLKSWAGTTLPTLQQHLQLAKDTKAKLK
ncbi:MAG TPA: DUF4142 domain-containing protein [Thermoanaerobaculia bacterium]|nr:DUF4142 domain-containing protein [Thermoanaerobaculia bacterium]